MFARVVTYAGGDPTRVEEVISAVRDRLDPEVTPALDEAKAFWMLVDRQKAQIYGISMFEDREKLLAALRRVEIPDAPRGSIKLDGYGNPIQNVFRKVERNREGELQNTVIVTIPAVSQFWKYNPEEFLRLPVYSRDVPPCQHC